MSLIDALLNDFDKTITPCANKKNEKKEEETQDAMPDSTTNTEKNNGNPFHCGDDVLVPNKDGRYYLGLQFNFKLGLIVEICSISSYKYNYMYIWYAKEICYKLVWHYSYHKTSFISSTMDSEQFEHPCCRQEGIIQSVTFV